MSTGASQIDVEVVREALEILGIGGSPIKSYATISMSTSHIGFLTAGNHAEFDTIEEQSANADISISSGVDQANGLITLPAGKVFRLECTVGTTYTDPDNGLLGLQWRNNTGAALLGTPMRHQPRSVGVVGAGTPISTGSELTVGFLPAQVGAVEIEVRIVESIFVAQIQSTALRGSALRIEEL